MKKSIIVIALALLMLVPVFAGSANQVAVDTKSNNTAQPVGNSTPLASSNKKTTTTDVAVTLNLYPVYYAAITEIDVNDNANQITHLNYDSATFKNTSVITMTVDKDNYVLNDKSGFYVSYFFYENTEDVTLTVSIDSDLTTTAEGTTADGKTAKQTIEYKATFSGVTIGVNDDGTAKSLVIHSNSENGTTSYKIAKKQATKMVADSTSKSLAFVLSPEDGQTIKNNVAGYYKSTITLKLTAEY